MADFLNDQISNMSNVASFTYENLGGTSNGFESKKPIWILGKEYDVDAVTKEVESLLWFSYRRNFDPIGGPGGPSTDTGWGCMLRCGQMLLAAALTRLWLGKDATSTKASRDMCHSKLLSLFYDNKSAPYSIHQIALMGVSEGKPVGKWFGPNTVAQVIRKLSFYDDFTDYYIHVAMDNTVVKSDIVEASTCPSFRDVQSERLRKCSAGLKTGLPNTSTTHNSSIPGLSSHKTVLPNHPRESSQTSFSGSPATSPISSSLSYTLSSTLQSGDVSNTHSDTRPPFLRPCILIVPLRLGLSDVNEMYIKSLKACLRMPQSLGMIGGKPNHAYYFIGFQGDKLVYLDPHTVQPASDSERTYHCREPSRMAFTLLDPSVAIAFLFKTRGEFDAWCLQVDSTITDSASRSMFELVDERPCHWPEFNPYPCYSPRYRRTSNTFEGDLVCFSDDDFEIVL